MQRYGNPGLLTNKIWQPWTFEKQNMATLEKEKEKEKNEKSTEQESHETPKAKKVVIKSPDSGKGKGRSASKRKSSTFTRENNLADSQPDSKKQHTDTDIPIEEESGLILETVKDTKSQSQCPWSPLPQRKSRKSILKSGSSQPEITKSTMKSTKLDLESPVKTQPPTKPNSTQTPAKPTTTQTPAKTPAKSNINQTHAKTPAKTLALSQKYWTTKGRTHERQHKRSVETLFEWTYFCTT